MGTKMRKSLGDKKNELTTDAISEITDLYSYGSGSNLDNRVKDLSTDDFCYAQLVVEQPLRLKWNLSQESFMSLPDNIRASIKGLLGKTFTTREEAKLEFEKTGLNGKNLELALKRTAISAPEAHIVFNKKGEVESDPELRSSERLRVVSGFISKSETERMEIVKHLAEDYLKKEIHPHLPDAWIAHEKTKLGFEIPFTRQFYKYIQPRPSNEILSEIMEIEKEIQVLLKELSA
jgi:type I restriction enzyme M protein